MHQTVDKCVVIKPAKGNRYQCMFCLLVFREIVLKKAKIKAKKKPRRRSDSSGGYTLSDIIHSPPAAGKVPHREASR